MKIDVKKFKEDYPNMTTTELMGKYNLKYNDLMKLKNKFNLIKNPKYYYYNKSHKDWRIHKGGVFFGAVNTEEEAKKVVEYLKRNNWNKELVKCISKSKYYNRDKRNNTWRIEKRGKWYGYVKTEEEAKRAVKFLKRNDWDKELFQKYKNEIIEEW